MPSKLTFYARPNDRLLHSENVAEKSAKKFTILGVENSIRFYVKLIFENLKVLKLPILSF